jgi:hypothetical protein
MKRQILRFDRKSPNRRRIPYGNLCLSWYAPFAYPEDNIMLCRCLLLIVASIGTLHAQNSQYGSFSADPRNQNLGGTRNQRLLEEVRYIDPSGYVWIAPAGTVWDGATIPSIFWSFVGGPHDGPYRDAALIHDVACCEKLRPWRVVARMFYDAAMCRSTPLWQAKLMYFAILAGGPKWPDVNPPNPESCLDTTVKQRITRKGADDIGKKLRSGQLTPDEKAAVAAATTSGGVLQTNQIDNVLADLRKRDLSRGEKALIADAVKVSRKVTVKEARDAATWIENTNPSLELIEQEAEKVSLQGTQEVP